LNISPGRKEMPIDSEISLSFHLTQKKEKERGKVGEENTYTQNSKKPKTSQLLYLRETNIVTLGQ